MHSQPLTKEVLVNAPASKVWKAITDKDEMKQWYFDLKEFKPEVGFEFQFYGGPEEKQYLHLCRVTEVIPDEKLTYSWRYDGYPGNSFVTFELFTEGDQTRVKLTHEGLDSFPGDPDFAKENFAEGWNQLIGISLKEFVEKNLRSVMTDIKHSIVINSPVEKVWDAIIDPRKLEIWMLVPTNFEPEPGKNFYFKGEADDNWDGYIRCQVKEIIENEKISFTWNSQLINAETLVTISLKNLGNKTELTLIHSGWDANAEIVRGHHDTGWQTRIYEKIKQVAES